LRGKFEDGATITFTVEGDKLVFSQPAQAAPTEGALSS
jgi:hypothetical protein